MIKSRIVELAGKDTGLRLKLFERPALVADRAARAALNAIHEDPNGGVIALALRYIAAIRTLGPCGLSLLAPFVDAHYERSPGDWCPVGDRHLRDWRNVERLQQAALLLHVDFLLGRAPLDIPVTLQADMLLAGIADIRVTFCSAQIATVLESGKATYRELETDLSTEDVYNIVEVLNVSALRDYHSKGRAKP